MCPTMAGFYRPTGISPPPAARSSKSGRKSDVWLFVCPAYTNGNGTRNRRVPFTFFSSVARADTPCRPKAFAPSIPHLQRSNCVLRLSQTIRLPTEVFRDESVPDNAFRDRPSDALRLLQAGAAAQQSLSGNAMGRRGAGIDSPVPGRRYRAGKAGGGGRGS